MKYEPPKFEKQKYILHCDRELPADQQTIFLLKPLSVRDMTEVKNLLANESARVSAIYLAARRGIVGWENLIDLPFRGKLWAIDREGDGERRCSDEEFDKLASIADGKIVEEIGKALITRSELEDVEKN